MGEGLRTGSDPDCGAIHLSLENPVGDLAEIFDSGEGSDHCSAPGSDSISNH